MIRPRDVLITLCRVLSLVFFVSAVFMFFAALLFMIQKMPFEQEGGEYAVWWVTTGGYGPIFLIVALILKWKAELIAEWIMDCSPQETIRSGNEQDRDQKQESITCFYSFLLSGIGLVTIVTAVERIAYHVMSKVQMYLQLRQTPFESSIFKLNLIQTISFVLPSIFIGVIGFMLIDRASAFANLIERIQIGSINSPSDSSGTSTG